MGAKEVDYTSRGYSPEQIAHLKKHEKFNPKKSLGLQFTKPFSHFPCDQFDYLTLLFTNYNQHGLLPFPGTISEQPNLIIEIFNIFKALISELEETERKKQARK